jgi:hypothetical protein
MKALFLKTAFVAVAATMSLGVHAADLTLDPQFGDQSNFVFGICDSNPTTVRPNERLRPLLARNQNPRFEPLFDVENPMEAATGDGRGGSFRTDAAGRAGDLRVIDRRPAAGSGPRETAGTSGASCSASKGNKAHGRIDRRLSETADDDTDSTGGAKPWSRPTSGETCFGR